MGVVGIFWDPDKGSGCDIHVARDPAQDRKPVQLDLLLWLARSPEPNVLAASEPKPPGVTITFAPNFAFTEQGHGITVAPNTGEVTIYAVVPPRADKIRTFIVEATVTETRPGQATQTFVLPIRIHIHNEITRTWLTPSGRDPADLSTGSLTVRMGADGQRLSVLAEFDDGTVGDISHHAGLEWTELDAHILTVGRFTGKLAAASVGQGRIQVSVPADLRGGINARMAFATLRTDEAWSARTRVAKLHRRCPGTTRLAEIPNVLFLSEGYRLGEEQRFEEHVNQVVDKIATNDTLYPFNRMVGDVNYWYVFIPSQSGGSTVRNGLRYRRGSQQRMEAIPVPRKPTAGQPPAASVENLLYQVGLPVPADSNVSFATRQGEWEALYSPQHIVGLRETTYLEWRALARYTLAFHQDTALGLATGADMQVAYEDDGRSVGWHPRRSTRAHLDTMLALIVSNDTGTVVPIGPTWSMQRDPALPAVGKDRDLVFALVAGARNSGSKDVELVSISVGTDSTTKVRAVANAAVVEVVPHSIPQTLSPETWTTVVHETGHVYNLEDEYGGFEATLTDLSLLEGGLNVQAEVSMRDGVGLDAQKILWNWPRISAVGILEASPERGLGRSVRFLVNETSPMQLRVGQVVRLRRRPLVPRPNDPNAPVVPVASAHSFAITSMQSTAAGVRIDADLEPSVDPSTVDLNFPRGALLYAPTLHPRDPNKELLLIWEEVLAHVHHGTPLNRRAAQCLLNDPKGGQGIQAPVNRPAGLPRRKPRYLSWLVGIYDGGAEYNCGVFHPAGACIMRQGSVSAGSRVGIPFRFCFVCRYIIIDQVDPMRHPEADLLYARDYPVT